MLTYLPSTQRFLLPAALVMAAIADALFYRQPWGINTAIFGAILWITLALRNPAVWKSTLGRSAALLAGLALFALVEEPTPLAVLVAIVSLVTFAMLTHAGARGMGQRVSQWCFHYTHFCFTILFRLPVDYILTARWLIRHPRLARRSFALVASFAWWLIPLAAGGIFFLLFSLANPIIETWLRNFFTQLLHILDWLPAYLAPARIFLWITVALSTYGLFRYRTRRLRTPRAETVPAPHWFNGPDMIIRCLVIFNAVFALETCLDILYLFGGTKLPAGMDYRDYAHRGAYPLVFTALLAGAFVLLAFRTGGPAHRSAWSRRLVYFWIAQNIFLMISTIWRIWLYVRACLLTELRVAAMIWVFLVAAGFIWIIIQIRTHRSNAWLWATNAFTLFAVLFICAFINFPGLIAEFNVNHCQQFAGTPPPGTPALPLIEITYLQNLGPAAIPAILRLQLADRNPADLPLLNSAIIDLQNQLHRNDSNWRGWTWRRARILGALEK